MQLATGALMKVLFLGCMFCLFSTEYSTAQTTLQDVVYLKNGSVIKGTIVEQIPNQSIKIKTADGSTFVYKIDEVEKITKEETTPLAKHSTNTSSRRGWYLDASLAPACTYTPINTYKDANKDPALNFLGGISVGGFFSNNVGVFTGLNYERYSTTFKNVNIGYTTTYNYYTGYVTTYIYGTDALSLNYLTIPVVFSFVTGDPGTPNFIAEVGPEVGFLLSAKETVNGGQINTTEDSKDYLHGVQLYGHAMLGGHIPLYGERFSLDIGSYLNAGMLNLNNEKSTQGIVTRNGALGLLFRLRFCIAS